MISPEVASFSKKPAEVLYRTDWENTRRAEDSTPTYLLYNSRPIRYIGTANNPPRTAGYHCANVINVSELKTECTITNNVAGI